MTGRRPIGPNRYFASEAEPTTPPYLAALFRRKPLGHLLCPGVVGWVSGTSFGVAGGVVGVFSALKEESAGLKRPAASEQAKRDGYKVRES